MPDKIPQVGRDGKHRLDCPYCGKLVFRFDPSLRGNLEITCTRPRCRRVLEVYFNELGPEWTP